MLLKNTTLPIIEEVEALFKVVDEKYSVTEVLETNLFFENLSINFENREVRIPNFRIGDKEKYLIVGKSGIGKSTLFEVILKQIVEYSGNVRIGDFNLKDIDIECLFKVICFMPQKVQIFTGTLEQNLVLFDEQQLEMKRYEMKKYIHEFELEHLAGKNIQKEMLSGGEIQRIGLIRVLLQERKLYLLDEPLNALDEKLRLIAMNRILKLQGTVLCISHIFDDMIVNKFDGVVNFKEGETE